MIEIRVDQLLEAQGRTFYWLAKETGISHTTLWLLRKGKRSESISDPGENVPGAWLPTWRPPHVSTETQSPKKRSTKKQAIVPVGSLSAGRARRSKRTIKQLSPDYTSAKAVEHKKNTTSAAHVWISK